MQSSNTQGTYGLAILDNTVDPVEDGLSEVDASLFYIDQDTGIGYTRQAIEGDHADDGSWSASGKVVPFVGDQAPPAQVTGLTVTPVTDLNDDGSLRVGLQVSWTANTEEDLLGYNIQIDLGSSPSWAQPFEVPVGLTSSVVAYPGLLGGTLYSVRVSALDAEGYRGTWSSVVEATTAADNDAPDIPDDVTVIAGYRALGVVWDRAEVKDFAFYQVRYYVTTEGVEEAAYLRTKSSHIVVDGLTEDVEYTVQVRSADTSNNVQTSSTDSTAVNLDENPEAGWSTAVTGTPTLIGASDLVVSDLIAQFIATGELSADVLTGGTLKVGGTGQPGVIEVYQGLTLIAQIDNDGMVMWNPANSGQAMWLKAGSLKFTEAWDTDVDTTVWTTAITPEGINASAISFGTEPGGSNSVPNAGFELADFAEISEHTWDNTDGWDSPTNTVNLTTGATATMTSTT